MANPQTIDLAARFLNADTLRWNAWSLRHEHNVPAGEGVDGYESFRVMQRQAGANMTVDVGSSTAGLMTAWVRGDTRGGQGIYEVDNIDRTAPTASTYKAQLNVDVATNGVANPRLDQVVLEVLDAQHTGASSTAQIRVVQGTATGGATLDNRTGAASLPSSAILLADILVPASESTSIDTADIRDRRQLPLQFMPYLNTNVNGVTFDYPNLRLADNCSWAHGTHDTFQTAVAVWLPRRIVAATRIRWKYTQGATANTGNYNIGIYDATGRQIVTTGATAFTGAANSVQVRSETITSTDFDAGWYYAVIGIDTATASGTSVFLGTNPSLVAASAVNIGSPGMSFSNTSGGTTLPTYILGGGFASDTWAATASVTVAAVPVLTLTVG